MAISSSGILKPFPVVFMARNYLKLKIKFDTYLFRHSKKFWITFYRLLYLSLFILYVTGLPITNRNIDIGV